MVCCRRPCTQTTLRFLWVTERKRKTENQLRDRVTTNRSRRSRAPFEPSLCGSQLFFPFFFPAPTFPSFLLTPPLHFNPPPPPEISFQHTKPCKNRPPASEPGPVCKDVPACHTASGCRRRSAPSSYSSSSLAASFLQR